MSYLDRETNKPSQSFDCGLDCLWLAPDPGASDEPPPLILYLHGVGERGKGGDELTRVARWGLAKFRCVPEPLSEGPFPFLVVAPQCPPRRVWWDEDVLAAVNRLLDGIVDQGIADPNRISVAGFSMGGTGSFCLALRHAERFAALVSVCGNCLVPESLPSLAALPAWIAYAEDDEFTHLSDGSRLAIDVLSPFGNVVGRRFRLGAVDGISAHARTADAAFSETALYQWLVEQRRKDQPPASP
jgi:Predicted peptidase